MTATENLARWREAEQDATEGPWTPEDQGFDGADGTSVLLAPYHDLAIDPEDATFIAISREAMPALLAFAEAVLALATTDKTVCLCVKQSQIRELAEQHLGGAS